MLGTLAAIETLAGKGDYTEYIKLGLLIGWGVCVAVVFMHATYNARNLLVSLAIGAIPIFGIIIYFLVNYIHGVGNAARRAKMKKDRHWEFVLTNKGKKKDPNAPEDDEDDEYNNSNHRGHMPEIIDESPLSREVDD